MTSRNGETTLTVLRLNSEEYSFSRRRSEFAGLRRRGGYSVYQTRQPRRFPESHRTVIAEKSRPLPAFSLEGIRWDVLLVTLSLILLVIFCILGSDLEALVNGGSRIGKLHAGIASLEESNSLLREQISRTAGQGFLVRNATGEEPERIVVLSPAPME